jgi:hypothetical protein
MKQTKLFQYAIFFEPTEKELEKGEKTKILKDVTNVLSSDEKTVAILASREIPDVYLSMLEQVNIVIRPF